LSLIATLQEHRMCQKPKVNDEFTSKNAIHRGKARGNKAEVVETYLQTVHEFTGGRPEGVWEKS